MIRSLPNSYLVHFDEHMKTETSIVGRFFDGTHYTKWAIVRHSDYMSSHDGNFYHEPLPSGRDEAFFKEFRFDSIEEAEDCFFKFHG